MDGRGRIPHVKHSFHFLLISTFQVPSARLDARPLKEDNQSDTECCKLKFRFPKLPLPVFWVHSLQTSAFSDFECAAFVSDAAWTAFAFGLHFQNPVLIL